MSRPQSAGQQLAQLVSRKIHWRERRNSDRVSIVAAGRQRFLQESGRNKVVRHLMRTPMLRCSSMFRHADWLRPFGSPPPPCQCGESVPQVIELRLGSGWRSE